MYDIRQFKPVLYFLVLIGVFGFALAAESVMLLVVGVGALGINAWLVNRGLFKPMPRIVSNVITIISLIYVIQERVTLGVTPVLIIGEFLMLLQMVKLWEQRGNRDYAQLLMLSLLLMVASAISTANVLFGLLMVIYLFLALYCCLLFHLKVETDAAREAMFIPARKVSPAVLRQDQRKLTQSMRKLTGVVSLVSIVFAVAVFILFPRGTGAGMLGPVQFKATQALVGFADEVSFQNIARIQQNETMIASVKLRHNGDLVRGGMPLILRGVTLDSYSGKKGGWRWLRWPRSLARDSTKDTRDHSEPEEVKSEYRFEPEAADRESKPLVSEPGPAPADNWSQDIMLLPTGTNVLFAMAGPYSITPRGQPLSLIFSSRDGELRNKGGRDRDRLPGPTHYEIVSSNTLGNMPPPIASGTLPKNIDPLIPKYIAEHNVGGTNAAGSLVAQRQKHDHPGSEPDDLDEEIARNIESHLKSKPFTYSLDLTDTRQIEGRDPLVTFLYDTHRGHCEYYAGAMTLMCQSIGIKARMVLGFRSTEYNNTPGADNYVVRQSHAHAWVEVFTKEGWKSFDPTSEYDSIEQARHAGLWQKVKHVVDFLQFSYGNTIITYSNDDRASLLQNTESAMMKAAVGSTNGMGRLNLPYLDQLWASTKYWTISWAVILTVMLILASAVLALVARYAWDKWTLRRRAARIGIGSLPHDDQLRLARQLQFYDNLLSLLGRHRITRAAHQTPMEFSRSLLFLPSEAYETIRRLTELFYKIRYGRAELSPARQKLLGTAMQKLESELALGRGR